MEYSNQLWKLMGEQIFLSGLKSVMVVVITARKTDSIIKEVEWKALYYNMVRKIEYYQLDRQHSFYDKKINRPTLFYIPFLADRISASFMMCENLSSALTNSRNVLIHNSLVPTSYLLPEKRVA
jgi:hypothetical protein